MKKLILIITVLVIILTGCSIPKCVERKEVEITIPESSTLVKNYLTGLPTRIIIPAHIETSTECVRYE